MRYYVYEGMNRFESNSRDAVKHAKEGGLPVVVTTKRGKVVSRAEIDCTGNVYRVSIGGDDYASRLNR